MRIGIWDYLGIEPTSDRTLLKRAYAAKLKIYHPEEDPEGFQMLRSAYESALDYAKHSQDETDSFSMPAFENEMENDFANQQVYEQLPIEEEEYDDTPLDQTERLILDFLHKTAGNYDDIKSRINPESWRELLEDDRYEGIELRYRLGFELLRLFMDRPWSPGYIWRMFDEVFFWSHMELELQEHFSKAYVDHIMMQLTPYWDMDYSFAEHVQLPDDIDRYLSCKFNARQALSYGDLESAEQFLMEAAELIPDDIEIYRLMGEYWLRRGNWSEALKTYQRIYMLNAEDMNNIQHLAHMLSKLERNEEALDLYDRILAHHEHPIEALLGKAACLVQIGKEIEAILLYSQITKQESWNMISRMQLLKLNRDLDLHIQRYMSKGSDQAHLFSLKLLAEMYYETNQYEHYITTLKHLGKAGELSLLECSQLAKLLGEREQYEEAEHYYILAGKLSGNEQAFRQERLYLEAKISYDQSHYDTALSKYEEILSLNPGHLDALYYMAESLLALENYDRALSYFKQALEQENNRLYYLGAAKCLTEMRHCHEALEHYRHAELDDYINGFDYTYYACALLNTARYHEVLDIAQTVLECDDYPIMIYYYNALAHYHLKEYEAPIDLMNQYLSYDLEGEPSVFYAYLIKANCFMHLNKWEDAVRHYLKTEELLHFADESNLKIYIKQYAAAFLATREFDKALIYLRKSLEIDEHCSWTQLQIVRVHAELKQWTALDKALIAYFDNKSNEHTDPYIFFYSGLYMMEVLRYKDAVKFFKTAYNLGLRGDISSYYGLALFHTGDYHGGMDMTREALNERPGHPDYMDRLRAMEEHFEKRNRLFAKMGFMTFKYTKKPTRYLDFPNILDDEQLQLELPGVVIENEYKIK